MYRSQMESKNFSEAQDMKLIDLVRTNQALYNITHPNYNDNCVKEMSWKDISNNIGKTVQECKTRWRTIRDSYKKNRNKLRCGKRTTSKSKYNDARLHFLDQCFNEREKMQFNAAKKFHTSSVDSDDQALLTDDLIMKFEVDAVTTSAAHAMTTHDARNESAITTSSTSMTTTSMGGEHPIETFFRSMATTVMTFPPHLIAETRLKVCNLITEIELKALSEQNKQ